MPGAGYANALRGRPGGPPAGDPDAAMGALTVGLIARLRAGTEDQEGMAALLEKCPPRWVR